jgi:hypothetical protein
MEQLVVCKRCGSNACLEQQVNEEVTTHLCMGCGFTTSTLMTEGSEVVKSALETSPELYKDLMFKDQDGNIWMPSTITLPNKGMVFVDGTAKDTWQWAAVKAIPLQEGDKKASKDQTHKMDMKNVKHYGEKDFMDALEQIGFFAIQ